MKKADVYFFDEPTSALDDVTAGAIFDELRKFSEDKIIFVIAHDVWVERICNKAIVLKV